MTVWGNSAGMDENQRLCGERVQGLKKARSKCSGLFVFKIDLADYDY
jgi:hypothetical protein